MDIHPSNPPAPQIQSPKTAQAENGHIAPPSTGKSSGAAPSRSLRARPSLPAPSTATAKPTVLSNGHGSLKDKSLEVIKSRLAPDAIAKKRALSLQAKEKELKEIVEGHDTAIREQFHLERFVTMIEGWDPQHAKTDNSPVFLQWKDDKHNLLNLLPPQPFNSGVPQAGPSRRPRASLPARTTRQKAHERSELLAQVVAPVSVSPEKGKEKALEPGVASPLKGKGKGRPSEIIPLEEPVPVKSSGKGKAKATSMAMPPPPLPPLKKGKASRRATMGAPTSEIEAEEELQMAAEVIAPNVTSKRRGRMSLPNYPPAKKLRGVSNKDITSESTSTSPALETPASERPPSPSPIPTPKFQPSLAHIPFPPVPPRPRKRIVGPRLVRYTDPSQRPAEEPKHAGDITHILNSYIHINDAGTQPDMNALETRAKKEGFLLARVAYLQQHGRLQRLLDQSTEFQTPATNSHAKIIRIPPRKTDHQDSLLSHMTQVRNAIINESKARPFVCKKLAKMIQVYWERIEGREERERLAEEKERKRLDKEVVKGLRKRWALAVKVVRAKIVEAQKIEQDRLGKEHLKSILQRSTGLLEAQVQGPEDEEDDDEDDDEDDHTNDDYDMSDGTDEVSAAGVSDEEEEEGEEEEEEEEEGQGVTQDGSDGGMPEILSGLLGPSAEDVKEVISVDRNDGEEGDANKEVHSSQNKNDLRFFVSDNVELDVSADAKVSVAEDATAAAETGLNHVSSDDVARALSDEPLQLDPEEVVPTVSGSSISNGHTSTQPSSPQLQAVLPVSLPRSGSRRPIKSTVITAPSDPDPDVNDAEFDASGVSDLDEQDAELDEEMEDGEGEDKDSEDEGLLADSEVPIEVLLKRYGYPVPGVAQEELVPEKKEDVTEASTDILAPVIETMPPQAPPLTPLVQADQSLTDTALSNSEMVDQVNVGGKRERKKRDLWSPDDAGPQALVGNRKRQKLVSEVNGESKATLDEQVSPEEELDEEEDEDDEEDEDEEESEEEEDEDESDEGEEEEQLKDSLEGERNELDAPRIRPPFLLRGTLRPYQQAGLEWLASLWTNNMNGILADEMGLGKTIQTIALLGHLACEKGIWGQHLIIVPTSVILNWEMEFKKFLPGMKVLTYYGNQKERKEKRVGWHTENTWQVCITSYQIVLADQHIFRRKSWTYMILDEAHNIKNFRSQRWQTLLGFKAQRRLLLTGTPLQNNLMELWSLLYFLMPGGIGADATAVVGFANHKNFMEWFSNPMDKAIETGEAMDEETLETVAKLHTLLRPFILRRLKAEVETQLPGKFEHVVYCRLSKRQRFLYDEFMARASTREALTSGGYLGVMNTLMQLRKVCNHPDLFEVRPVRTSFAMNSVVKDYEPRDILVRKRLWLDAEEKKVDALAMGLQVTQNEGMSGWVMRTRRQLDATDMLPYAVAPAKRGKQPAPPVKDTRTVEGWLKYCAWADEEESKRRWSSIRPINRQRCSVQPIYGSTLLGMLGNLPNFLLPIDIRPRREETFADLAAPAANFVMSLTERAKTLDPIVDRFAVIPPNAVARELTAYALPGLEPISHPSFTDPEFDTLHRSTVKLQIAFPDASLLQYDCGKLQKLWEMLRDLKAGGHRVLIFTQMTRVLDILEMFLSYNGHRYLRLDGSTKIEDRQVLTERFNSDSRIFVFIASSRSGGVGINLTGADTVFFYDSDWNPSMDRQCMDRAHRIGQTREVHIYRFVSSHTVEENMLRKAEQKRLLDRMVIQDGGFNNDWWGRVGWKDMFGTVPDNEETKVPRTKTGEEGIVDIDMEATPIAEEVEETRPRVGEERELAKALAEVEDEEDVQAAKMAQGEGELDLQEFEEGPKGVVVKNARVFEPDPSGTPMDEDDYGDDEVGGVEEYMLKWVEENWEFFVSYRV